jgi:hypothetical protein
MGKLSAVSEMTLLILLRTDDGQMFFVDGSYDQETTQMLFWDEIKIITPKKPKQQLDVSTKVLV